MQHNNLILGLDIGGTKTAIIIGTPEGEIVSRKQFATEPTRGFKPVFEDIIFQTQAVIQEFSERVSAISVSIGGPLDVLKGIIKSPPNLPHWDNIPLKDLLKERLNLPVYIEHDGNAGALAEFYFGAGRGFQNVIFVTMGTGLGAGIILDGRLYRGTTDTAGEIGHVRIAKDGPECYGKRGSFEGYGSGTGITKLARETYPHKWGAAATTADLYADFKNGSDEAKQIFLMAADHIGLGFADLIDTLNPQRIIMGGLGMRIGDAILPRIHEVIAREALPIAAKACEIVPAELGERIGDLAALCAALDQGGMRLAF